MLTCSLHFEDRAVGVHLYLSGVQPVWHRTITTCLVPNAVGPDSVSARAAICASRCATCGCAGGWPACHTGGRSPCTVAAVQGMRTVLLYGMHQVQQGTPLHHLTHAR